MSRARLLRFATLAALTLAALAAPAAAKPRLAILGLEVVGDIDTEQARMAQQLTTALRERASAGTGPYQLARGGPRELVDEKLMNNCANEAMACMAPIGAALGADVLMYGHLERVDSGYHLTLKLLRVDTRTPLAAIAEVVPLAELKTDLRGVGKRAYARVTATGEGTVTVRIANVDRATVYLDDQPVGTTASGLLTIAVPEGRHKLTVVPSDKRLRRHEQTVMVNAGDARNIPLELGPAPRAAPAGAPAAAPRRDRDAALAAELRRERTGAVSEAESRTGWRALAVAGAAVGVAGGGVWIYGWTRINEAEEKLCATRGSDGACEKPPKELTDIWNPKGERGKHLTWGGATLVGVGGALGLYGAYRGFFARRERPAPATAGRSTRPRRTLTVTPVVSSDGGGATVRFDW
jgi:hypothetical protein